MKKLILIFLITILVFSIIGINIVLADNKELNELETQQFKILKLSKIVEEHPSTIELKEDMESYKIGLELYQQSDYQQAISESDRGRLLMLSNSVIFSGQPMGSGKFLNLMVEALGEVKL